VTSNRLWSVLKMSTSAPDDRSPSATASAMAPVLLYSWEWCEQPRQSLLFSVRLEIGSEHDYDTAFVAVGTPHKTAVH
jgi:hypothetical protein